jgi:phage-related protein
LDKPLFWLGSSRAALSTFPVAARQRAGFQLRREHGLDPDDWRAMPSVGSGVREIRIHADGEHRVFYVAVFAEGVYVLHAFRKKTQQTTTHDIALGRERFGNLLALRQAHHGGKRDR